MVIPKTLRSFVKQSQVARIKTTIFRMRNTIISIALLFMLSSCGNYAERAGKGNEIIMIGSKPYKMVYISVDGSVVTTIVPADSQVSVIPFTTIYRSGKSNETIIKVD